MDPKRQRRLIEAVADAMAEPEPERDRILRERLDDPELLAEARAMIRSGADAAHSSLTRDVEARLARAARDVVETPIPERIGPYEVIERLGEGGMGVVYLCRQVGRIEREVAVKIMRRVGSRRLLGRFEAEIRSLARLEHRGIAEVFDAGATDDGLPYFAMEYVRGPSLLAACDARALGIEDRILVFLDLCDAVHFAHQRGVIHRDLKPSNVLTRVEDGEITPKVIDFGIARDLASEPSQTAEGSVLGTIEYMSPEQARGAETLDVRTDVYALGMILYELLTGLLPFPVERFRTDSPIELHRLLNETDRPTPSGRVSMEGEGVREAAARRSISPEDLGRTLRGDLDWVVLRALEIDPDRRYQSVEALRDDLERFLRHEPVRAAPPSLRYRAQKFARRNRLAVIAAGLILLSLTGGTIAATVGFLRANEARAEAELQAARAASVTDFVSSMIASVRPDEAQGDDVTVLQVLDSAAARLNDGRMTVSDPAVEADVRMLIGESYESLSRYEEALPLQLEALELRRGILQPDDTLLHSAISNVGESLWLMGRLEQSLPYALELLELRRRTYGQFHTNTVSSLNDVANTYADLGRLEESEAIFREANEVSAVVDTGSNRLSRAYLLNNMATVLVDRGKFEEAIPLHVESMAIRREFEGDRSLAVLVSLGNMAAAQQGAGRLEEAEASAREALALGEEIAGLRHLRTGVAQMRLGSILLETGRAEEAGVHFEEALRTMQEVAPDSHRVAAGEAALAQARLALGRTGEAESLLRSAWDRYEATFGAGDARAREVAGRLADLLADRGSPDVGLWRDRAEAAP